jgi:hypothetical protein
MFERNFINVDDVIVNRDVIDTPFLCDLSMCKGACCTLESDYGAPLNENDIDEIKQILPLAVKYLSERNKEEIQLRGFYEKRDGELLTRSINRKECVFVYYDDSIAKCAIEKAYYIDKTNYKKPVSCHLFPIRVNGFGGDIVRYEKFQNCSPAIENGAKQNIKIVNFCKEALERKYGKEWYSKLMEVVSK